MSEERVQFVRSTLRGRMAALVLALLASSWAQPSAVVVRHDKTDAETLKLGERFSAVGRVHPDGGCTLVAPTWAVTAAHVARRLKPGGIVQFGGKSYDVKQTIIHPEAVGPAGAPPEVDLALIEFSSPVEGIDPIGLYRGRGELGKSVILVGYGDYGPAMRALQRTDGRRRAVTNVVDDAGLRRIFMSFDEPPKGSSLEGVGGPGDSGGPALIEDGGRDLLAGVSSASMNGKAGTYGVVDVYTRVSSYLSWIDGRIGGAIRLP